MFKVMWELIPLEKSKRSAGAQLLLKINSGSQNQANNTDRCNARLTFVYIFSDTVWVFDIVKFLVVSFVWNYQLKLTIYVVADKHKICIMCSAVDSYHFSNHTSFTIAGDSNNQIVLES